MVADSGSSATGDTPPRITAAAAPPAPRVICRRCGRFLDATDAFCPHCGARQDKGKAWYYHPIWILLLALVALGPIALFLVWKSSRMGRTAKLLMAALILAYTGLCAYYTYEVTTVELTHLRDFGDAMRQIRSR